jgi:hypothetical protein
MSTLAGKDLIKENWGGCHLPLGLAPIVVPVERHDFTLLLPWIRFFFLDNEIKL